MKQLSNIISIAAFIALLPFIYVANKIQDYIESRKLKPINETHEENIEAKTTFPEGYDPNDFNAWSEHIYKLNQN